MSTRPLWEVASVFLKLGTIGFGGPAAHIALMRDEVVVRRSWLDERDFLDLVGACHLIPGPNSTELAIHLGRRRAGPAGLVVAGICFIGPATAIVCALAWVYVRFGTTAVGEDLLWGVKAVMLAIVAAALVGLGRTAVRKVRTGLVAVAACVLYLLGVNELVLLFGGALVVAGLRRLSSPRTLPVALLVGSAAAASGEPQLWRLAAAFLKVGALLYGSGYVLLAFLRNDLVRDLGWLTERQLLDAVSIGQLTPGPVFTTATFVGYVLLGWTGALVATVAIFVPSFVFVAATHRLVARIRSSAWAGAALDGVNASAVGLLAGVLVVLARDVLSDPWAVPVCIASAVIASATRANSVWLVLGGLALGAVRAFA